LSRGLYKELGKELGKELAGELAGTVKCRYHPHIEKGPLLGEEALSGGDNGFDPSPSHLAGTSFYFVLLQNGERAGLTSPLSSTSEMTKQQIGRPDCHLEAAL
jgi:hypothetical protein